MYGSFGAYGSCSSMLESSSSLDGSEPAINLSFYSVSAFPMWPRRASLSSDSDDSLDDDECGRPTSFLSDDDLSSPWPTPARRGPCDSAQVLCSPAGRDIPLSCSRSSSASSSASASAFARSPYAHHNPAVLLSSQPPHHLPDHDARRPHFQPCAPPDFSHVALAQAQRRHQQQLMQQQAQAASRRRRPAPPSGAFIARRRSSAANPRSATMAPIAELSE